MKLINSDNNNEIDAVDFMNQEYESSENKNEIDYWSAYSKVILESLHLRSKFNLSQSQLADLLRTTQSVISRFENMGRLPSYDFLARMAQAFKDNLGITLSGNFMAVVPLEKQQFIDQLAKKEKQETQTFVQGLLDEVIFMKEKASLSKLPDASKVIEVDFTAQKKLNKLISAASGDGMPAIVVELPDRDYRSFAKNYIEA